MESPERPPRFVFGAVIQKGWNKDFPIHRRATESKSAQVMKRHRLSFSVLLQRTHCSLSKGINKNFVFWVENKWCFSIESAVPHHNFFSGLVTLHQSSDYGRWEVGGELSTSVRRKFPAKPTFSLFPFCRKCHHDVSESNCYMTSPRGEILI